MHRSLHNIVSQAAWFIGKWYYKQEYYAVIIEKVDKVDKNLVFKGLPFK